MTGFHIFETSLQKTNELFDQIENELGWTGHRNQTYSAVRTILHALRDRLTVEQSAHLAAELPILLKGVFYDGWHPANLPIKMNREEFVAYVTRNFQFQVEGGHEELIRVIVKAIFRMIGLGEAEKVYHSLPKDIRQLIGREEHILTT